MEPARRQEEILRAIGKRLKYTDKVGRSDDAALIRDIFTAVGEEKSIFFLIRLVDRCHEEYYKAFEEFFGQKPPARKPCCRGFATDRTSPRSPA